jgi:transposase-like protein
MKKMNVPKYYPSKYKNKAEAVLDMLKGGETVKQIKNRMAVSDSYIYAAKKKLKEMGAMGTTAMGFVPKPGEFVQADTNVDTILNERASTYGSFKGVAEVAQEFKALIHNALTDSHKVLDADQVEALDMIASKIARIVNGNPDHTDSWLDIAGYATLVADRLQGKIR